MNSVYITPVFCFLLLNISLITGSDVGHEGPGRVDLEDPADGPHSTHPPGGFHSTHPPGGPHSTHPPSICSQCQCLGIGPYSVDCDDMNFKQMPIFFKDLAVPWHFRIDGNSLTMIPEFPKLENLTGLSFAYNKISSISESAFKNLPNLTDLNLSHNNLTDSSLSSKIFKGPNQDKLADPIPLEKLSLSHNHISRLPKHMFQHLKNLTSLNLSHNPIKDVSIPTANAISELRRLKKLDLSFDQLDRLPDHFFSELVDLEEVNLSGNNFVSFPTELNYARSLKTIYFNNNNHFKSVTNNDFWKRMKLLDTLYMSNSNTLSRIDDEAFGNLTSLKKLWITNNTLFTFVSPTAFKSISLNYTIKLTELNFEKNRLEHLPEEALDWANISTLNLQENPWRCDCNMEWFVKTIAPAMQISNYDLTVHLTCAYPEALMGRSMTETRVQEAEFECKDEQTSPGRNSSVVIATIIIGSLLLVTGTLIFSYVLFRRTRVHDWVGRNVKYRRTQNEDEEIVTSNIQY